MNKKILQLTVPNIISNITIPLLGMVDLAIVGHYGGDRLIAAMAIGTAIFNLIYWNFGFLRMGTSGFTAQAYGARDLAEATRVLVRGVVVALCIAFLVIGLQFWLLEGALALMDGSEQVEGWASDYFRARIWAAPATLSLYAFTGWFIGMQNAKTPMWISIVVNIVNVVFSFWFVAGLDMGIAGVAWGTVVAQYSGLLMAVAFWAMHYGRLVKYLNLRASLHIEKMLSFFNVNKDIFLRTICLVAVFTFFTSASSSMGDTVLAVNTLLLQLFTLFSYVMDGFAYAGEALVGRYSGSGNGVLLRRSVRYLTVWGMGVALCFTVLYAGLLTPILSIFTESEALLEVAQHYRWWVAAVPLMSFLAFIYDGILIGATQTKIMRNCMFVAATLFFGVYYALIGIWENNALWVAFLSFLLIRGVLGRFFFRENR